MLTKKDIELLRQFRSTGHPVVSVYLNTDGKSNSKKNVETALKEMSRLARLQVETADKEHRRRALAEIQKVDDYIVKNFKKFTCRGLALFSCSGEGLWHEVELPRPPRNRFVLADAPFVRPLQFQEVEYHRFCTVLLDTHNARIFLIDKGAILEYKQVADEVPAKVRRAGWSGYDETRTDRKVGQKISEHLHHVANTLFELYKRDQFEWLILSGKGEYLKEFESILHSYLKEKVVARLDLPADTPEHEVLDRAVRAEKGLVFKQHCRIVERLQHSVGAGAAAVTGLEDTLRHLNAQAVDTLVVARDFQQVGVSCVKCHYLGILEQTCPLCNSPMVEAPDVVTLAIDRALEHNCEVQQVYEGVGMDKSGQIGALLRFRL
jgi:peptide subunit release factor 1 (eRF1)